MIYTICDDFYPDKLDQLSDDELKSRINQLEGIKRDIDSKLTLCQQEKYRREKEKKKNLRLDYVGKCFKGSYREQTKLGNKDEVYIYVLDVDSSDAYNARCLCIASDCSFIRNEDMDIFSPAKLTLRSVSQDTVIERYFNEVSLEDFESILKVALTKFSKLSCKS